MLLPITGKKPKEEPTANDMFPGAIESAVVIEPVGGPGGWNPSRRTTPVLSPTRARLSTRLLEIRPWVKTSFSRWMSAAAGRRNERPLNSCA